MRRRNTFKHSKGPASFKMRRNALFPTINFGDYPGRGVPAVRDTGVIRYAMTNIILSRTFQHHASKAPSFFKPCKVQRRRTTPVPFSARSSAQVHPMRHSLSTPRSRIFDRQCRSGRSLYAKGADSHRWHRRRCCLDTLARSRCFEHVSDFSERKANGGGINSRSGQRIARPKTGCATSPDDFRTRFNRAQAYNEVLIQSYHHATRSR